MDIFHVFLDQNIEIIMQTRSRVKKPSEGIFPKRWGPLTKLKVKKSPAQRVPEHREMIMIYDHGKVKEETCCR